MIDQPCNGGVDWVLIFPLTLSTIQKFGRRILIANIRIFNKQWAVSEQVFEFERRNELAS